MRLTRVLDNQDQVGGQSILLQIEADELDLSLVLAWLPGLDREISIYLLFLWLFLI